MQCGPEQTTNLAPLFSGTFRGDARYTFTLFFFCHLCASPILMTPWATVHMAHIWHGIFGMISVSLIILCLLLSPTCFQEAFASSFFINCVSCFKFWHVRLSNLIFSYYLLVLLFNLVFLQSSKSNREAFKVFTEVQYLMRQLRNQCPVFP